MKHRLQCQSCKENIVTNEIRKEKCAMGNLVTSSSGKDVSYADDLIKFVILSIALVVIGFILANLLGYSEYWPGRRARNDGYYVFLYGGWILAFLMLGLGAYLANKGKKTELFVYENAVKGIGFSSSEYITAELTSFSLDYDRIASVDVMKKSTLSINAYGKVYIMFVQNPHNIAEEINNRIKKAVQVKNESTASGLNETQKVFCTNCGLNLDKNPGGFCSGCGTKRS